MLYSTNNMMISLNIVLADYLRDAGYDIYWYSTGTTDSHTSGLPESLDTITLVPEFPVNPVHIVRLNSGNVAEGEIAVPAFSLQLPSSPRKVRRDGLGSSVFERERILRIDGFARNSFQHRALHDLFYEWVDADVQIPIYDYDTDPNTPTEIDPVYVQRTAVDRFELVHEVDTIRYYIRFEASLLYYE